MSKGITKTMTKIYIVDADTNPSTLADTNVIKGEISNWDKSGGNENVEYASVFGGKITRKQDRDEYTISFDLIFNFDDSFRWEEMNLEEHSTGVYVPGDSKPKMIVIEASNGTSFLTHAFNNCNNISLEMSHSAETTREGSIEFTLSHITDQGVYNYQVDEKKATELQNWSALTEDS